MQGKRTSTVVDRRSGGLHSDPETKNARETLDNCPRTGYKLSNLIHSSKNGSVETQTIENDYDNG